MKSTYYVEESFLVKPYFDHMQAKEIWGVQKPYFNSLHKFQWIKNSVSDDEATSTCLCPCKVKNPLAIPCKKFLSMNNIQANSSLSLVKSRLHFACVWGPSLKTVIHFRQTQKRSCYSLLLFDTPVDPESFKNNRFSFVLSAQRCTENIILLFLAHA